MSSTNNPWNQSKLNAHERAAAKQKAWNNLTEEERQGITKENYEKLLAAAENISGLSASAKRVAAAAANNRSRRSSVSSNSSKKSGLVWKPQKAGSRRRSRKAGRRGNHKH